MFKVELLYRDLIVLQVTKLRTVTLCLASFEIPREYPSSIDQGNESKFPGSLTEYVLPTYLTLFS